MQLTMIELQRQLDNLIRIGTVTAVRSGECRVKTGDLITNWRPYLTER
ncbi:phage baseplate assembly protein V, partial [Aeromonas hydrophila]